MSSIRCMVELLRSPIGIRLRNFHQLVQIKIRDICIGLKKCFKLLSDWTWLNLRFISLLQLILLLCFFDGFAHVIPGQKDDSGKDRGSDNRSEEKADRIRAVIWLRVLSHYEWDAADAVRNQDPKENRKDDMQNFQKGLF